MSERDRPPRKKASIRRLAELQVAGKPKADLDQLTPEKIRQIVHELEVHQVELEIQNRQLEETQRETELSRSRYRQLYESAPISYLTLDAAGTIVSANPCAEELFRLPRALLVGRKFSSFVAGTHQDRWYLARRALLESAERRSLELSIAVEDGGVLEVGLTASGRLDEVGTLDLGILDLTELRRTERALRTAAAAVSLVEEHERRKLASDLHDDAGQLISLAALKLRILAQAVGPGRKAEFAELSDLLAQVRNRISSLSFQMSPPLLHDVGLQAATKWLAEDLERSFGLVVKVVEGAEIPLDEVVRIVLFRAIRELLINVKKHAGCDTAQVQIWREGDMVRVAVEDGGSGFDADVGHSTFDRPERRGGFGLLALRERLGRLGGTLEVGSRINGSGSRVVVSLPIPPIEGEKR